MIISRTPYRVSFFGGGTDYPQWYLKEGGSVLSTTIDKYCYISCRYLPPFFGIRHRIVWSHIETVNSISEVLHPAVRSGLSYLGFDDSMGLEIHHQGDLPARSGIGSSSSFSVGLIHALLSLRGQSIDRHDLALRAIELEQTVLKESVGSQDQVAASYGGLNTILFHRDGTIKVTPVCIPPDRLRELASHLLLLYTGQGRLGTEIASSVTANMASNAPILRKMHLMVTDALNILNGEGCLKGFGELLHEGWMLKRSLADGVTNPHIDNIYETARAHGAIGGKLLGAGKAGFMLLFVPPEKQRSVRDALAQYLWAPFSFEFGGSKIIYNDKEVMQRNDD